MGDFRIEINATGGHGCQRDLGDKALIEGCGAINCPDCIARKFVAELKASGASIKDALLIHWPNSNGTIVDNLVTKMRGGNF